MPQAKRSRQASVRPKGTELTKRSPSGTGYTQLIREIFRINGELVTAGNKLGKDLGLSTARWQVLGAIRPEPLAVPHIARYMGLARQNVQRVVDLLIEEGLLELQDNPHHRRAKLVALTAEGRKQIERISERQTRWANRIARSIPAETFAAACELLRELRERLEKDAES